MNNMSEETDYEFIEDPADNAMYVDAEIIDDNDFGEVLELTEYTGNSNESSLVQYSDAEYQNIDIVEISKKQENLAKSFVSKVEKFILKLDENNLTREQKLYISTVSKLELNKLSDLMILTESNKMLLNNMLNRINSVQAEDYAMIQTYNTLVNQHIKLHKEVSNTYKNIPLTIKKLQADVIGDLSNALPDNTEDNSVMTQDFGVNQFNNTKQMLKNLQEQKEKKRLAQIENNNTQ